MSKSKFKTILGMQHVEDDKQAIASLLTYWVFSCRDTKNPVADAVKTWTYLESSIENSAFSAESLESYVQGLTDKLSSSLKPKKLFEISGKKSIVEVRQYFEDDEMEIITLLKSQPSIIQTICRVNHEWFKEKFKDISEDVE